MEHGPHSEANIISVKKLTQLVLRLACSVGHIQSSMNPVHVFTLHSFNIEFNIIFPSTTRSPCRFSDLIVLCASTLSYRSQSPRRMGGAIHRSFGRPSKFE